MKMHTFTVYGIPVPQGSKKAFWSQKIMIETSADRLKQWRSDIKHSAIESAGGNPEPTSEPVDIDVEFTFPRPKHHTVAGKGEHLKEAAPTWHYKAPDIDKLLRAVNDALTGVFFMDDKQVARVSCHKRYAHLGAPPKTTITIKELEH